MRPLDTMRRRDFLTLPLAADPAPLVADPDFRMRPRAPADPVRVGIIGMGGRGVGLLNYMLETRQGTLAAICDIQDGALRLAREPTRAIGKAPEGFLDYRELLAMDEVEAVFIATPVDLHREMAVATIEAGKHCYCEKPLGRTAAEARAVQEAASKSDRVFQVGFQWKYNSRFRASIEAVHRGEIGEVKFIDAQRHNRGDQLPKPWLMDRDRSGDIIVEQACHEMNVFCWAMGTHPARACGLGGTNFYAGQPPGRSTMDHYTLSLDFANGCRVAYSHMLAAQPPLDGSHIRFFGAEGAIDAMAGEIYVPEGRTPPEPRAMRLTGNDTFNAVHDFLRLAREGGAPAADAASAAMANGTAVLGRTAIYNKRTAHWDEIE